MAEDTQARFAGRVFFAAGIYGIIALLPLYLVELGIGPALSEPLRHPEHFYGFVGVALAWQFVFLIIARDVRKYRVLMLPAMLEKLAFGVPAILLYAKGRAGADVLLFGGIDLLLCLLFARAFMTTGTERPEGTRTEEP